MQTSTTTLVKSINLGRILGSMVANTTEAETDTRSTASRMRECDGCFVIFSC